MVYISSSVFYISLYISIFTASFPNYMRELMPGLGAIILSFLSVLLIASVLYSIRKKYIFRITAVSQFGLVILSICSVVIVVSFLKQTHATETGLWLEFRSGSAETLYRLNYFPSNVGWAGIYISSVFYFQSLVNRDADIPLWNKLGREVITYMPLLGYWYLFLLHESIDAPYFNG